MSQSVYNRYTFHQLFEYVNICYGTKVWYFHMHLSFPGFEAYKNGEREKKLFKNCIPMTVLFL